MSKKIYDVLIIGAGISGTFIARELSKYELHVAVLEKENDVGNKTTNANSAIIHSGYDPVPGTLKAKFNVLGNAMYDQIADELDVEFHRIGSLTVATEEEQLKTLEDLAKRSEANGVEVKLLNKEEVLEMEPNLSKEVKGALFAPTAGIIDPFNLCVHAMENAIDNGVELFRSEEVIGIEKEGEIFVISTKKGKYYAKIIINAAGNYADKIASMVEDISWSITSRKGEYYVLDHFEWGFVKHTIFPLPSAKGKGVLVSMTTSGNYIVGPSSEPVDDKDDYSTDSETLANIKAQAVQMVPSIPFNQVIRVFSGLRPTPSTHDFIIEPAKSDDRFINVAGIESPGLVSSPAIAKYVVENYIHALIKLENKSSYNPRVKKYHRLFNYLMGREDEKFFKENKDYNQIICNCEKVSLGEIKDVLSRSCPPYSVKGLKRRTRAGYGKCQGGFCQSRVVLLLAKERNVSPLEITLDDIDSYILTSKIKDK